MKLTMRDRIVLLNILPPEGDITTIKVVHKLRMELAPSEKEIKDYKIRQEKTQILWDDAREKKVGAQDKKIGPKAFSIIEEAFQSLNKQKKLNEGHLETYMKFCGEDEDK